MLLTKTKVYEDCTSLAGKKKKRVGNVAMEAIVLSR
jgi:hypothetical protein